jgi:integration host factor subunit alpha
MSLTKARIVESIQNQTGFPKNKSSEIAETLLEIIKRNLASGEDVLVSRFGKFCVNEKKERKGRNPSTGDAMMLAPRKVVTFKCSGKLRERINSEFKSIFSTEINPWHQEKSMRWS